MKRTLLVHSVAASLIIIFGLTVNGGQPILDIQSGVKLSWPTATGKTYQPRWSPASGGAWITLGGSASGDGLAHSLYDPAALGARRYQVLEIVPGTPATAAIPTNGGFEFGSGATAGNWTLDTAAGGLVYGVRTNNNPHKGAFNFEVHLASTGAGPVVQLNQSGMPVVGGTTYPFTFYASALTGSASFSAQWRILWNAGGDTGYQTFTPGNNAYVVISNSVTAPAAATSATLFFHFGGAAITNQWATIDLDDVALGSGSSPGVPGQTNALQVDSQPVVQITWPTASGTQYQPVTTTNLASAIWTTNSPVITGDGGATSLMLPMTVSV